MRVRFRSDEGVDTDRTPGGKAEASGRSSKMREQLEEQFQTASAQRTKPIPSQFTMTVNGMAEGASLVSTIKK